MGGEGRLAELNCLSLSIWIWGWPTEFATITTSYTTQGASLSAGNVCPILGRVDLVKKAT